MKTTRYFEEQVLRKRPYIKREWCEAILREPVYCEVQPNGRIRYWGFTSALGGRALRVVTLEDGETVHNTSPTGISGYDEAAMKLHYYPETDSLCIDLNSKPSTESREIADGLVLDFDSEGSVVGIDIDHASEKLDLKTIETTSLPASDTRIA